VTTWIWPVGSIGLQQLWPEIVLEKREKEKKREGDGRGTEVGSRKRRINDIILPNPSNGCKKVSSSFSPSYKVSVFPSCPLLSENRRSSLSHDASPSSSSSLASFTSLPSSP